MSTASFSSFNSGLGKREALRVLSCCKLGSGGLPDSLELLGRARGRGLAGDPLDVPRKRHGLSPVSRAVTALAIGMAESRALHREAADPRGWLPESAVLSVQVAPAW